MRLNISPTPWASLRPRPVAPCHMGAARTRALSSATAGSESWAGRGGAGRGGAGRAGGHLRGARAAAHRRVRAGRLAGTRQPRVE